MNHVTIKKKNESYLQIDGDTGVLMEIYEHFSFQPTGYKFMPAFKARRWDGYIRLFNTGTRTIYAGLLDPIKQFLESKSYSYSYESNGYYGMPNEEENIGYDDVENFSLALKLTSAGKRIEARDYQLEAVTDCLRHKRRLIVAPTSSGKSLFMYILIRYLMTINQDYRFLIIVPTTSLVNQLTSDFADYSAENGWNAKDNIHKIMAGEKKNTNKNTVISTWQSIYKLQSKYFNEFDVILCDEAHKMQANSITGIFEKATDVKYRIGCTGTLNGSICNSMVLSGLTGTIQQMITTKELIDRKQVTDLEIKCLLLRHSDEIRTAFAKKDYETEISYLVTNGRRNKFIANLAVSTSGTTLVLYRFVEKQGKELYKLIKEKEKNRDVYFISGSTSPEEREHIRAVANNKDAIIIASLGTTSTGVNLPAIENIIFAHPSKGKITNLQSIGRGLRLKEGKQKCFLYDISDDMSLKGWINYSLRHLGERIKIYTSEKFKFNITKIDI